MLSATEVVAALRGDSKRDVYESKNHRFYISYPQGLRSPALVSRETVKKLFEEDVIIHKWAERGVTNVYVLKQAQKLTKPSSFRS